MSSIIDSFLYPRCVPEYLDKFIVRKSILTALNETHINFYGKLLDVGCGQMPYKSMLISNKTNVTTYIGLDFHGNPIHNNKPDITWNDGVIPLDDNSVDCAICTEVLEHCPDPTSVLSEICRVLKPGGSLFFTVPFLWPLHEVPFDEYRYTPYSLIRHLEDSGLVDIDIRALGGWDASLAQMLGLWVRRRKMNRYIKIFLSYLFTPIIWLLYRKDIHTISDFDESMMITGLSGTAKKKQ